MFKISINYTNEGMVLSIYQEQYPGKIYVAKKINLEFEEVSEGGKHEPTLCLGHLNGDFFLSALREALEPMGLKREKEIRMKERIKALEAHLEDLRQILKISSDPKRLIRV